MSAAKQVPVWGLVAGAAVALALGVYSVLHEPTGRDFVLWGFESAAAWKNALTLVVALLLVAQAVLSFKLAGMFGFRATARRGLVDFRRLLATLAIGFSLPVAFHCVWVLGFGSDSLAISLHSILGCIAYGCVVATLWPDRGERAHANGRRGPWALAVGATQYVVGVGAVAAVVMLFTLQGATPQADARQAQTVGPIDAERLYEEHCANCHASDGSGGLGTRLAGLVVARYPDPADQSAIVASGLNTMPAFAKVIAPDEIAAITTYTRTAWE
ncbi:MAG: DUF6529 family protein [Acidimicrobiaceae bacterium]|nr:DUF6529 family protein [Acidimicrobiaceae bacterium]